jgi:hypothetical protein
MHVLDKELAFFNKHKGEWVKNHPDKFALVKDEALIGTFDTAETAVTEGAKRFGSTAFLVRKISQSEENVFIPSLTLGLLYATA